MKDLAEKVLLEILYRMGIHPQQDELEDFENRLICGLWNKIKRISPSEKIPIKIL